MPHDEPHPLAGKNTGTVYDDTTVVEVLDWWDRRVGRSWRRPQAIVELIYADRVRGYSLPTDDEVVYVHINGLGYLLHASELKRSEK